MTVDEFEFVLSRRLELIRCVLSQKGKEYSSDADRLHNFKKAAAILRITPLKAALSFASKHITSVVDLVERGEASEYEVDEKIGDTINYMILIEALFSELRKSKNSGHWLVEKE